MTTSNTVTVTNPKLSVQNLDFFYGRTKALKSVSLDLPEKSVTAFIGPSGCGKSTLLRVLNRIYELYPNQKAVGKVLLDGNNILASGIDLNLLRAKVGMVFQKPVPFPMSIYDNIAYGIRHYEKLSRADMDARVQHALGLSGGQQQRLCIARAVALRPEVILFDEPTSALDPIATVRAMHRRCCWPPERLRPLALNLSLTSVHSAARRSADSTRASISDFGSLS